MDRKKLIDAISSETDTPNEKVDAIFDAFETIVLRQMAQGREIRCGRFFRMGTMLKRLPEQRGVRLGKNPPERNIRYRAPYCKFGNDIVDPLKARTFPIQESRQPTRKRAEKQAEEEKN